MIHTVKGFGIVNKAEVDVFLELSCFFDDPMDVGNLISGSSSSSSSFLPGLLDPLLIPLFFFSFFFLPCCEGICLALLGVWSLLLMYSRFSLRIVPFVDVFLRYSWGETNSASYSSTTLDFSPHKLCCLLLSWALRKPNFLNFLNNFFPIFLCSLFLKFLFVWLGGGWVSVFVFAF